jgi:glycosidase
MYNGQEAGLDKRIAFFEKDPIVWGDGKQSNRSAFYRKLLKLRRSPDDPIDLIETGNNNVFAFHRGTAAKGVTVFANLSDQPQTITAQKKPLAPFGWTIKQ